MCIYLMAVEQCQAGIVCDQIHFHLSHRRHDDDVLPYAGCGHAGDAPQLKAVPMQMHRMGFVALIVEHQAIAAVCLH